MTRRGSGVAHRGLVRQPRRSVDRPLTSGTPPDNAPRISATAAALASYFGPSRALEITSSGRQRVKNRNDPLSAFDQARTPRTRSGSQSFDNAATSRPRQGPRHTRPRSQGFKAVLQRPRQNSTKTGGSRLFEIPSSWPLGGSQGANGIRFVLSESGIDRCCHCRRSIEPAALRPDLAERTWPTSQTELHGEEIMSKFFGL
jgi:hypothetical protein